MKKFFASQVLCLFLCFFLSSPVSAKPMPQPTLEMALKSNWVVVARYEGWDSSQTPQYFGGVLTKFKTIYILKGNLKEEEKLNVSYAFQDGSACIEPSKWKFSPSMLPEKNSEWILFLQYRTENKDKSVTYSTYRGDWGRWKYHAFFSSLISDSLKTPPASRQHCPKCGSEQPVDHPLCYHIKNQKIVCIEWKIQCHTCGNMWADPRLAKIDSIPDCPSCKNNSHTVPIVYGEPSGPLLEQSNRGEVTLGGCIVDPENPRWHCKHCEKKWK